IKNFGNVVLAGTSFGPTSTFYLAEATVPAGTITLGGNISAGTTADAGTISLHGSLTGGIDNSAGVTLTAASVILSSDTASTGAGTGSLGTSTNPILSNTAFLSAQTKSDVFVQNKGDVQLGTSSVGSTKTFSLFEDTSANGSISILSNVSTG